MNLAANSSIGTYLHHLVSNVKSFLSEYSIHQDVILEEFDGEFFEIFEKYRRDIIEGIRHMNDENGKHDIGFSCKYVVNFMLQQLLEDLRITPTPTQFKIAKKEIKNIASQYKWDDRYFL